MASRDKAWVFSTAQAMPNATQSICTYIFDWTSSELMALKNTEPQLWLVVTCNTVPTGTSLKIEVYQHSTTTITSGDLLMTGRDMAVADMSAKAQDPGHWLFHVPVMSVLGNLQADDVDQYMGIVMDATGNCSDGKIDAWLQHGQPLIPTTQVLTSNI
jgi:predicted RecA/RadA family phage recombinase